MTYLDKQIDRILAEGIQSQHAASLRAITTAIAILSEEMAILSVDPEQRKRLHHVLEQMECLHVNIGYAERAGR